ncbi:MAG: DUF192 domain-containing protein [Leptospirales bacterium]|nr:DUF192 domain-containing protein [Leptospirales bacterium]
MEFFRKVRTNRTRFVRLVSLFLLIAACDSLRTQHLKRQNIRVGEFTISAEIAASPSERERGLMYRTSLGDDEGMLFVFPEATMQAFWMKNTLIPLDVAYFDDQGYLIEVVTMQPDGGARTYPSSEPTLYALEMKAGWFAKRAIRKYTRLTLPQPIRGM